MSLFLGQQSGFPKYPYFLCMWDSRDYAQQYTKKDWTLGEELMPCKERNIINDPLVDRDRILFPPLNIKLGLIKQFTKALDKGGDCFRIDHGEVESWHLWRSLDPAAHQRSRVRNLNEWSGTGSVEGIFLVIKNFLGNNKARKYAELVNNMLTAFRNLGCNMSVNMHYLFSHMDRFPEKLRSMSDEQEERFHQDLKEMETRYQGRWDTVMMADYGWNLKRDHPAAEHSRSSKKRKFEQWWSSMQFTCTYLYQSPPFSLQ